MQAPAVAPAGNVSWPDPILPDQARVPDISTSCLPGAFGEMAEAVSEATQTPSALAVLLTLSVLGAAAQRGRSVAPTGTDYVEPPSIWTLTAMPSGARKTAVLSALTAPLLAFEKRERDRLRPEVARVFAARGVAEKRIEHLRHAAAKTDDQADRARFEREIARERDDMPAQLHAPRLFVGDATPERLQALLVENRGAISILSDEAGVFAVLAGMYNGGAAALDVLLQGHSGSPVRVDRQQRSAFIDAPRISLGLAIQPGVLAEACGSPKFRHSGLLARFLYGVPRSNLGHRDVRRTASVPADVRVRYAAAIDALLEHRCQHLVMQFDTLARERWYEFAAYIERELGETGRLGHVTDWAGKLPGQIARVAALLELAESGPGAEVVGSIRAFRAIELGECLIDHALAAFRLLGADQTEADAQAVLGWIRGHALTEFTRVEVHKGLEGRLRTTARVKDALERLAELHIIDAGRPRRNPGTRPSHVHQVNPKFTVGYAELSGDS